MSITTEEAWTGYRDGLLRYIRARSRSIQDAEDILQEVFVKVHRRIGTLQDDRNLGAWLYRVAHNAVVDFYRKKVPIPVAEVPEVVAVRRDEPCPAEQTLAPVVGVVVGSLPTIYRQALTLTEVEGLTQTEVARRLGLSNSGAKSRVQRGRALAREWLLACCDVELDRRRHVIDYTVRQRTRHVETCPCAPETPREVQCTVGRPAGRPARPHREAA